MFWLSPLQNNSGTIAILIVVSDLQINLWIKHVLILLIGQNGKFSVLYMGLSTVGLTYA